MDVDCCWNIVIAEYGDNGKSSCYLIDVIHVKPQSKRNYMLHNCSVSCTHGKTSKLQ